MAGFVERISVIIDTKVDGALSGIKGFRSAVAEADGFTNKFKAGWKNASAQVSANAGMLAATAGTALVAFGVKAVEAFQNTAKAAIDLSKATGLSVEQASRWIAVADDYGVSASTLATALGRIGKNLDGKAMAEYGIATRDAAGNARDANDIFLDVLGVLNNTAPAERAKVGADLLGKGYKELAPIVGKTRAEYEKMLSTVEDGQVITDKEAKKSEKMRLAQDKLTDALGEFTLATGEAASGLAPLVERIAEVVALATELGLIDSVIPAVDKDGALDKLGSVGDSMRALLDAALKTNDAVAFLMERGFSEEGAIRALGDYKAELEAAAVETGKFGDVLDWVAGPTQKLADKSDTLSTSLDAVGKAANEAADDLFDLESAQLDLAESAAALAEQQAETDRILADSKSTDAEKKQALIDLRQAQIGTAEGAKKAAEAFAQSLGAQDGSALSASLQVTALETLRAKFPELTADINKYIAALKSIPSQVYTNVGTSASGGSNTGKKGNWGVVGVESVDAGDGRGQRDSAAPIVVQLMLDGRAIAEITAYQEAQKRGTR